MKVADLFCGAGGTSTGAIEALTLLGYKPELTAINHWELAVSTHSLNHPKARHLCASLDTLNPKDLFKEDGLDILWASPECTHHSVARGGKPINDQSRATAWCVTRWAEALRPKVVLIENVPEFAGWGPIGSNGKPLKSKKGETFKAWCAALESCGYRVEWRILCAADYGDPTTRRRLFVQAVRGRRKIVWPDPTHGKVDDGLFKRRPYRTARDIIDWSIEGESVFNRKRPLSEKTMQRIEAGLNKYGLAPFLVPQQSRHVHRSLDKPLQTVTGTATGEALVRPFIVAFDNHSGGDSVTPADAPISTITTKARHGVAEPYLVELRGTSAKQIKGSSRGVDKPLPTITAGGGHIGVCEPYLVYACHGGGTERRVKSVDDPMPTVTGSREIGVAKPFLIQYYGNSTGSRDVDRPLDTVTTKERFGLVQPIVEIEGKKYHLDIRFRMLQPHELAAAQGFPRGYLFEGNKSEQVKQIGNAVPCGLARALVLSVMSQRNDISEFITDEEVQVA
jgi:DNA (cytosine-5)-methyltransferase 1